MTTHLVITGLGDDKPGLVNDLSEAVLEAGCNVEDSRMVALGGKFAVILMASGNWNMIAKLESGLGRLQERLGMSITAERTSPREGLQNLVPYAVDVVSADHPGIVHNLSNFFYGRGINIEELVTNSYRAAHTGTPMFSVHMEVAVPSDVHIAQLREAFTDFCDELNLDAVIEPLKS